jgi:hypothetical protein
MLCKHPAREGEKSPKKFLSEETISSHIIKKPQYTKLYLNLTFENAKRE